MKTLLSKVLIVVVMSAVANGGYVYSDYNWHTYNGHQYAITLDYSNWVNAEAEAQALNPNYHLVTINDADENTWLTSTLGPPLTEPISSFAWIGFYQDHSDFSYSEPDGGWKWISGEATTFVGWGWPEPNNEGQEDYGVLESDGQWNDWGPGATAGYWDTYGIIETPEPATMLLLGLGGIALRRRKA